MHCRAPSRHRVLPLPDESFSSDVNSIQLGVGTMDCRCFHGFLKGKVQQRKLWVKLPAECNTLLGGDENTRMLLLKPCCGQLDAPRGWYSEAVDRLLRLKLRQHVMDPCCFLMFETDFEEDSAEVPEKDVGSW